MLQLRNEVKKLHEKLSVTESLLEHKVGQGLTIFCVLLDCENKEAYYLFVRLGFNAESGNQEANK